MKKDYRPVLLVAALLAGCSQVPGAPMSRLMITPGGDATQYGVLNTSAPQAQVDSVSASSVSNPQWFAATNTIDGNLSSAWGPAATDAAPTLTFALHDEISLSAMAIKMSGAAMTVDVAVSVDGSTWTTVATGLTPTPTVLDQLSLTAANAQQVRLTFNGQDAANLLVCEVQFFGGPPATPTPAPTPLPSVQPSVAPSTAPSCTPPVWPSCLPVWPPVDRDHHGDRDHGDRGHHGDQDHGHHVSCTGSFDDRGDHDRHKIDFCVNATDWPSCSGDLQVTDEETHLCLTGTITFLQCDDARHRVTCRGTLSDGQSFDCSFVQDDRGCRNFEFKAPGCHFADR